jgi:thymidylate synthase
MNISMRSNDAFKAAFMNMFAFTELQKHIADEVGKKLGRAIGVGQYVHSADSFHIYGSYFEEFKGFLQTVDRRTFEERVWETEYAIPMFEEAKQKLGKESAR